jgi:hypothetical protein
MAGLTDDLKFAFICVAVNRKNRLQYIRVPLTISTSFGIKFTPSCNSRQGCLASRKIRFPEPENDNTSYRETKHNKNDLLERLWVAHKAPEH